MLKKYHDTFYEGNFYHIFNRGINNETIFKTDRNYHFFFQRWHKYVATFLDVYAYCLMPDHFHFFVKVKENALVTYSFTKPQRFGKAIHEENINTILEYQFMLLFRSYAHAFNKENNRTGSLFQKSFKRIRVDNNRYFLAVIQYIHNNPIHHHYTNSFEKWQYSSYNAILSTQPTQIKRAEILEWFGSKDEFIEFHLENIKYEKIKQYVIE